METFIYGLKDPITKEIRYIGKSDNPQVRYKHHLKDKRVNPHRYRWIAMLAELGQKPELVVLEKVDSAVWEEREKYWIEYGLKQGWGLTNISSGGAFFLDYVEGNLDWAQVLHDYFQSGMKSVFKKLDKDTQKKCVLLVAAEMTKYSWIGIKQRGGNPETEYDSKAEYMAGVMKLQELLA